jgi:radical SAM protein with 4Fe4S-binding SPASM domain
MLGLAKKIASYGYVSLAVVVKQRLQDAARLPLYWACGLARTAGVPANSLPSRRAYRERQFNLRFPPKHPPSITIEPVNACNLRCQMCPYSSAQRDRKVVRLTLECFAKLVDEVRGKVRVLGISGSGEPLLNQDICRMVAYANSQGLLTRLTTNAQLLTAELSTQLLRAGLDQLRISIDGATAQTYESIRAGASFARLLENLENLRLARASVKSGTQIVIHTVLQRANLDEFRLFKPTFARLADRMTVTFPCTYGEEDVSYAPLPMVEPYECKMLWSVLTVLPDGDVSICCNNHYARSIVGNAFREGVLSVWHNKAYGEARRRHLLGKFAEIDLCRNCRMTPSGFINEARRQYALLDRRAGPSAMPQESSIERTCVE